MLKLEKLDLYNWCNFVGSKSISFSDGFNVINGKNGGGKTSIVNAISILLLNRYEGNFEGFINNESTEASAELKFQINSDTYISQLKLKKGKGVASERCLLKNGTEIANGENCAKELDKVLPSFLTSYSMFYRQSNNDKVTECTDSERRDLLSQLVSIDYSEKIEQFITPNIDKLKLDITELEKVIFSLENKTYSYSDKKPVDEPVADSIIRDLEAKIKLWEENNKNIEKQQKLKSDIEAAENDIEVSKTKYDSENIRKQKEQQIETINKSLEEQLEGISKEKEKIKTESKARLQSFLDTKKDLEEKLSAIATDNTVLEDFDYFQLQADLTKLNQNIASLKTKQSMAIKNIESLKNGVCPVCGNNCEHKLQDFQNEKDEIEKSLKSESLKLTDTLKAQEEYEKAKKEKDKNELQKVQLSSEISKMDNNIANEKTNTVNAYENLKSKEKLIEDNKQKELATLEENVAKQLETAKELLTQKIKYLNDLQLQFNAIEILSDTVDCRQQLQEAKNKNLEIEKVKAYNRAVDEQNALIKKQEEEEAKQLETSRKQMIDLKNSLADYNLAFEIMNKTYPTWKLERSLKDIENKTNSFIEDIYKPLYIQFVANKNSLKMTYGNGLRELPIKRLSGAEKQIVNLAVENVFNQQQQLSCLVLDESDSAMDTNNKNAFFTMLLSLKDYYEQILVITHSSEVKDKLQVEGANTILL